ncbi:redoxin domain-containing protein [Halioglobus sp. Uisw_031]|uniref:redoxin domain-containing protein n=1 Tax=Halioglobus sp. Uisw_031 TaxID=3230977 RepID=UPI0039EB2304
MIWRREHRLNMKNIFKVVFVLILLSLAVGYLYREPIKQRIFALITQGMFVAVDNDDFDPGPAIHSHFPGLQATYQDRSITLIDEFKGVNGTAVIASRSFDWCPYCMRQIIQLQENKAGFDAAGIGMVAITYDDPVLQQAFIEKFGITIPVVSDVNALSFKTLGILNKNYSPGEFQYGIPHPGMIVIDPQGKVVGKLFLEAYSLRVDAAAALAFAKTALGLDPPLIK